MALNCVANGRILREGPFKRLGQPAAGDAGGALGVAQLIGIGTAVSLGTRNGSDPMQGSLSWPRVHADSDLRASPHSTGAAYLRLDRPALLERIAGMLADEKIVAGSMVGWSSDRGPLATGVSSATRGARTCRPR